MNIYTTIKRGQRNFNIVGTKLDFYPRIQAKSITRQNLSTSSWLRSLEVFGSKSIPILVRWEALFLFSSVTAFPLLAPPTVSLPSSSLKEWGKWLTSENRGSEEGKEEDLEIWEKECPEPYIIAFLTLREWTIAQSESYTCYGGSNQNRCFGDTIPTSTAAS